MSKLDKYSPETRKKLEAEFRIARDGMYDAVKALTKGRLMGFIEKNPGKMVNGLDLKKQVSVAAARMLDDVLDAYFDTRKKVEVKDAKSDSK